MPPVAGGIGLGTILSAATSVIGFISKRKSEKKRNRLQRESIRLEKEAQDRQRRIDRVRNIAERQERFRRQRAIVAQNTAAGFQGVTGGGSSVLQAANAGVVTSTAVNVGRANQVTSLGNERNSLMQQAAELRGQANQVSSGGGFLFDLASQFIPSQEQFRDAFVTTNSAPVFNTGGGIFHGAGNPGR